MKNFIKKILEQKNPQFKIVNFHSNPNFSQIANANCFRTKKIMNEFFKYPEI